MSCPDRNPEHLESCPACDARFRERLGAWPVPEPADGFEARVLARMRRSRTMRILSVAAQIAVFALGAVAGILGARWMTPRPTEPAAVEPSLDVADDYLRKGHP